jgi:hypothetical protein
MRLRTVLSLGRGAPNSPTVPFSREPSRLGEQKRLGRTRYLGVVITGQRLERRPPKTTAKATVPANAAILPERYYPRSLIVRSWRAETARKRRCKSRSLSLGRVAVTALSRKIIEDRMWNTRCRSAQKCRKTLDNAGMRSGEIGRASHRQGRPTIPPLP